MNLPGMSQKSPGSLNPRLTKEPLNKSAPATCSGRNASRSLPNVEKNAQRLTLEK